MMMIPIDRSNRARYLGIAPRLDHGSNDGFGHALCGMGSKSQCRQGIYARTNTNICVKKKRKGRWFWVVLLDAGEMVLQGQLIVGMMVDSFGTWDLGISRLWIY